MAGVHVYMNKVSCTPIPCTSISRLYTHSLFKQIGPTSIPIQIVIPFIENNATRFIFGRYAPCRKSRLKIKRRDLPTPINARAFTYEKFLIYKSRSTTAYPFVTNAHSLLWKRARFANRVHEWESSLRWTRRRSLIRKFDSSSLHPPNRTRTSLE